MPLSLVPWLTEYIKRVISRNFFRKHTQWHSAEVNDVICTVNLASTILFSNFRNPGPDIPKITLKIPRLNVRTEKQVYAISCQHLLFSVHNIFHIRNMRPLSIREAHWGGGLFTGSRDSCPIKLRAIKFACYICYLAMADRIVWQPKVIKSKHSRVVGFKLKGNGNLVLLLYAWNSVI